MSLKGRKLYNPIGQIGWMPFWWGSKFNKRLVQKRLRRFYKEVQDERD